MLDRLKKITEDYSHRVWGQAIKLKKENRDLYEWLMTQTSYMPESVTVTERVYAVLNPHISPICEIGNKRRFDTKINTYVFCGRINNCECYQKHHAETYTPLDAETMSRVIELRKQTWLAKYGTDNPSKNKAIQIKRQETWDKKSTENRKNLQKALVSAGYATVVERVKDYVSPLFTIDEYKGCFRHNFYKWECVKCGAVVNDHVDYGRIPRCMICKPYGDSKEEDQIRMFVESFGIKVIPHHRGVLKNMEYDLWLPDQRLAIEYNGVYWHSTKHREPDYHVTKFIRSREAGVKLIQIFEDEWLNKQEIVKSRLRSILGVDQKIHARKCQVRMITPEEYTTFTQTYHLQGYAPASHKLGLYFSEVLVAVMSFSQLRYQSGPGYELIRYCSKDTVVGGAGKLFKHFVKNYSPTYVVSYANRCWSDGGLYKSLGFADTTKNDNNKGYWYFKDRKRYHRSTFTKSRLVKMGYSADLTESAIMDQAGYLKIYDCGNYKFEWKP